jgi:hypothetical protein
MMRRRQRRLRNRPVDRAEDAIAGLLMLVAAAGLLLAITAGADAHADAAARSRAEASSRIPTTAILNADAPMLVTSEGAGSYLPRTTAAATWTAPDGTSCTGEVPVSAGARKGHAVPIWIEHSGILAATPTSPLAAFLAAVVAGAVVLLLTTLVLAGAWWATRRMTAGARSRAWEREWAAIEPQWRRNPR